MSTQAPFQALVGTRSTECVLDRLRGDPLSGKARRGDSSGDVTLKGTSFSERVFLLSPATHWAVLINTNGCHGCEELNSRSAKRVRNATNFATRLRSARADIQRPFRGVKNAPFFIAFKDLLALLDLERSQKVDLGTCRSQGPNPSLSLEGNPLRDTTSPNWGVNRYLLMRNNCKHNYSQFIPINYRPPSAVAASLAQSQIMKL